MVPRETKTGKALNEIFPKLRVEIDKYEHLREKFKKDPKTYGDEMKKLAAQWEIRVIIASDTARQELIDFEKKSLKLEFDEDTRNLYKQMKTRIKMLDVLKRHFS